MDSPLTPHMECGILFYSHENKLGNLDTRWWVSPLYSVDSPRKISKKDDWSRNGLQYRGTMKDYFRQSIREAVEGEKVKTVTAKYPSWISSFFQYGTVEIMTEWGESNLWTTSMYYVPHPTETAQYIQTMLLKDDDSQDESTSKNIPSSPKNNTPNSLKPDEVGYDVRNTVRDVLR